MAGDTAAMESLLADLLKQSAAQGKAQQESLAKLAKAAGLDPKRVQSAEEKLKELGDSAEDTARKTSLLSKSGNLVGSVLADLVGGLTATVGNLAKFATTTLSGNAKMSGLFDAFKDLPIIGTVASLFSGLIKLQEENLETYRSLSTVGVNFGSSISQLRTDFISMGLSSQQFAEVIKNNSEVFKLMGKGTTDGANNFKKLNKMLVENSGGLLQLGFDYRELSGLIGSYAKTHGGLSKQQQTDYAATRLQLIEYGKELDYLARVTGKSREAIAKEAEEKVKEANFQAYMNSLKPEEKAKKQALINQVLAEHGGDAADALKAMYMKVGPLTDASGELTALYPGLMNVLRKYTKMTEDSTITEENFKKKRANITAETNSILIEEGKRFGNLGAILQMQGDSIGNVMGVAARATTQYGNASEAEILRQAKIIEAKQEEEAKKKKAEADELEALLKAEAEIRKLAIVLADSLTPFVKTVLVPTMEWMNENVDNVAEALNDFRINYLPQILEWIKKLFSEQGRKEIWNDVKVFVKKIWEDIWNEIKPSTTTRNLANVATSTVGGTVLGATMGSVVPGIGTAFGGLVGGGAGLLVGLGEWLYDAIAGREKGSYGTTGKLFEDFGSGTPIVAHGTEGVFTPGQINNLMSGAATESVRTVIEQLNNNNLEMTAYLRQIAEFSRRNLDATRELSNNSFA